MSSTSQRSEVEGTGKSARFGNPKHAYTIATKRALDLKLPKVLGTLAQLGSVQDTQLSELGSTLRTLVVQDRESRCVSCFGVHCSFCVLIISCLSVRKVELGGMMALLLCCITPAVDPHTCGSHYCADGPT
jgi:hypothetical protein